MAEGNTVTESGEQFRALHKPSAIDRSSAQEILKIQQSELFSEKSPLEFLGEGGAGITGAVVFAQYSPQTPESTPPALGQWIQEMPHYEQAYPYTPGKYVEQPESDDYLAIKVANPKSLGLDPAHMLAGERRIMMETNSLFSPSDKNRPPRILGYGTIKGALSEPRPYLLVEYVPGNFVRLDTLLQQNGGRLSLEQGVSMALGLSEILTKMHAGGLVHIDLNDTKPDNVFFDPNSGQVRLIDYGNSRDLRDKLSNDAHPGIDREGLAQLLFYSITGEQLVKPGSYPKKLNAKLDTLPYEVREVIKKATSFEYGIKEAEGTKIMEQDLSNALRYLPFDLSDIPMPTKSENSQPKVEQNKFQLREGMQTVTLDQNGKVDNSWTIKTITPQTAILTKGVNGQIATREVSLRELAMLEEKQLELVIQEMSIDSVSDTTKLFQVIDEREGIDLPDGSKIDPATLKSTISRVILENVNSLTFNPDRIEDLGLIPKISGLRGKIRQFILEARTKP